MENNIIFYRDVRDIQENWEEYSGSFVRGYLYYKNRLYKGLPLLELLKSEIGKKTINNLLKEANGLFGAVLQLENLTMLIADKIRSYPLLYTIKEGKCYCADSGLSAKFLLNDYNDAQINNETKSEFAALGYVSGGSSLVDEIM